MDAGLTLYNIDIWCQILGGCGHVTHMQAEQDESEILEGLEIIFILL